MTNNNETAVDIYVYSRPVGGFGLLGNAAPQHLFIIMEFDKNDPDYKSPVCIRGGPKRGNKNYLDMLTKDMEVTVLPYEEGHVDLLKDIDYKTWPHSHLAVVSKSKAIMMINEAENFAKSIGNAGLDYKLPLTDFFGGGQNSNTIAKYVVEDVWDLNFKLPTYSVQPDIFSTQLGGSQARIVPFLFVVEDKTPKHISVSAPGINERLQTTYFDQLMNGKISIFDKYPTQDYRYDRAYSSSTNEYRDNAYQTWYTPFSWSYKSFTDLFPRWRPTLLDKQISLLQSYKPTFFGFEQREQYDFIGYNFYTSKWNNMWDIVNTKQETKYLTSDGKYKLYNHPGDKFLEEMLVISRFREYVRLCLNNLICKDDIHDLMNKALAFSNIPITDQLHLRMRSYTEAEKEAKTTILMGAWTNKLREELKYAASHVSPLVLDLDGDGIKLFSYSNGVYFDIDNDGFVEKVGWLSSGDGHLAIDANYNGRIDDITELFGDDLISAFFKLSLLDSNNDKVIDQKDVAFRELLIWQDKNFNGLSEPEELKTLKEANIKSISLHTKPDNRIIEGNTITSTSTFTYTDGREYEIADVHYHNDDMDSWYTGKKVNDPTDKTRYFDSTREFRQEVLDELSKRIKDPDSIDRTSDWIAYIIENKAIKYISSYTQKSIVLSQLELEAINSVNQQKRIELKKSCEGEEQILKDNVADSSVKKAKEEQNKLFENFKNITSKNERDINLRYLAEYKKAEQDAYRDINARLEQKKNDFHADYASEYSKKNDEIERDINARLLKKNQEDLKDGQSKGLNQLEMDKIFAANLAEFNNQYKLELSNWRSAYYNRTTSELQIIAQNYTVEYENKKSSLMELYKQKVKQEVTEINENERKEYSTAVQDMESKSAEEILSNIEQALHTHRQLCEKESRGLNAFLSSYFIKYIETTEKNLEDCSNSIKQECH